MNAKQESPSATHSSLAKMLRAIHRSAEPSTAPGAYRLLVDHHALENLLDAAVLLEAPVSETEDIKADIKAAFAAGVKWGREMYPATPSATAMRGECHDAAERDEGCFRAVRAERLLREAEARLSATLPSTKVENGEDREIKLWIGGVARIVKPGESLFVGPHEYVHSNPKDIVTGGDGHDW